MRATTDLVARWTASTGSRLSAAATVTISAPTIEKLTTTMDATTRGVAFREKPAVGGQVGQVAVMPRQQSENEHRADPEKQHDGRDFDSGEPEFELAERRHREQIRRGHQHHQA